MALVRPIINEIVAFDATIGTTITFTANGGDQVTKNEIKVVYNEYVQGYFNSENNLFYKESTFQTPIKGNTYTLYIDSNTNKSYIYNGGIFVETNLTEIVAYRDTTTTFNFSHIIPANTLRNGQYYKVSIRTYDALNNVSDWSNYQPFYCYTTPSLTLNITNGQTLTTSNFSIILTYNQLQNEKIDYAIIELYNTNKILLSSSDNMYNTDYPPLTFTYNIFGLDNHSQYYVKASIVTINGTITQTDMIRFYTNYDVTPEQVTLEATLDNCNGYVNLKSSEIFNIIGESNPNPLPYLLGQQADLRNATADINIEEYAYWAKWNHDLFIIPKDFLLRLWFYPARQPFEIIKLSNDDGTSYLTVSQKRDNTQDYLSIRTDNGTIQDVPLGKICNGNDKIFLWIKVVDNVWEVQFYILSSTATILDWNTPSDNIAYNVTSNITWNNGNYGDGTFTPSATVSQPMSSELTKVLIGNGIFDHLNITTDTTLKYNLIRYPYDITTVTNRGITFKANSDGSVTFSGTANNSSASSATLYNNGGLLYLPAGTYYLYGGTNLYAGLYVTLWDDINATTKYSGVISGNYKSSATTIYIYTTRTTAGWSSSNLYGYSKIFTIESPTYLKLYIRSVNNTYTSAVSGTVYPMLHDAILAPPAWTDDTVINVDFNNNLKATPHNYNKLVLKRKDYTLLNWINLSEINVLDNVNTYIDFNDSFIPTGVTQEYALVLYENNIPSEYHTVSITPHWGKYFLTDKDTRFVLNYAVIYSNHVQNIQNGTFMPIGATYPIIVQNGEGNFRSGSLQFKVLGYQFEINQTLDRISITQQLQDILKFLTNGKAKCLTDFNGNIFILKVVNSPQISYDANWGNGIATVSFDWVEQSKYNDYENMLELGLFERITSE